MQQSKAKVILIVEDDAEQRLLYTRVLESAGYRVVEAADSASALSQVHELRPDLVLMDVTLPGPSGWNATREIKSHPDTHRVPVLVVTGLVAQADRDASYASGSDGYLEKPVPPRRLLDEVARMLGEAG
ncbi:MAG: response regulator [Gemmatimonadetes bacterium]|nr:response regulator [Gemmatimonadota bacterium]